MLTVDSYIRYFADSFADCIETYGGKVDQVKAPVGGRADLKEVEEALKKEKYKVLTFTHVDTCKFLTSLNSENETKLSVSSAFFQRLVYFPTQKQLESSSSESLPTLSSSWMVFVLLPRKRSEWMIGTSTS